jgi:3-hydroxyacyl-CoA dehydrogenase
MHRVEVLASHINDVVLCDTTNPGCTMEVRDGIAILTLTNPPMNVLSYHVRVGIQSCYEKAAANPSVKAIVLTGKGAAFCAGADITEFTPSKMKAPHLPEVIAKLEQGKKPVVAAINGVCMGGGLETALACHYRVASQKAQFALPEVKLGLVPGAGGTQRLPRLIGVPGAIDLVCSGRTVRPAEALKSGLVDKLATGNVVEEAIAFAQDLVKRNVTPHRLCDDGSKLGWCITNKLLFRQARKGVAAAARGMQSPLKGLEAIEAATTARTFKEGMDIEQRIIMECFKSPQSQAMQHLFFSERRALKIPGLPANLKSNTIRTVGVVGGGTMGSGIAMNFLNVGIPVTLLETSDDRAKFAIDTIRGNYDLTMKKGKLTQDTANKRLALLKIVVNDYGAFKDVDYVIEAVFENMKLKKEIFAKLTAATRPDCILASNTSTLSVDEIASASSRPGKVIGTHFFSPANVMKLLELVRGKDTDAATIITSLDLSKRIKKTPVLAGNCFGFISNRMMAVGGLQAIYMLEEGCQPQEIDAAITGFGFPMGVFAMQDLAGLDVGYKIRQETPETFKPKRMVEIPDQLHALGRYGQKTQKGYYKYPEGRTPVTDPVVTQLVLDASKKKNIKRRAFTQQEILDRYLFALVNEGANILKEGYAIRPSDIDIVFIFGFGFPPYKGGPMHYADHVGIEKVAGTIQKLNSTLPPNTFPPLSPLLAEMVASKAKFAKLNNV